MKLDKSGKLELLAIVLVTIICVVWIIGDHNNPEPYFALVCTVFYCTNFYRKYAVKVPKKELNSLDKRSQNLSRKLARKATTKPEGVVAQCPAPNCDRIAKTVEEAEAYFGFRNMANGNRLVQSYCRKCR
ncbi:TPA: hypothetical protein ACPJZX_004534 [Vibrio diabolicus]